MFWPESSIFTNKYRFKWWPLVPESWIPTIRKRSCIVIINITFVYAHGEVLGYLDARRPSVHASVRHAYFKWRLQNHSACFDLSF